MNLSFPTFLFVSLLAAGEAHQTLRGASTTRMMSATRKLVECDDVATGFNIASSAIGITKVLFPGASALKSGIELLGTFTGLTLSHANACDIPAYVTFSQMQEYVGEAIEDAIEENNVLTWTMGIEMGLRDLSNHLLLYEESDVIAAKSIYFNAAFAETSKLYSNLFEIEESYLTYFGFVDEDDRRMLGLGGDDDDGRKLEPLSEAASEAAMEYKVMLLSVSQLFAVEHTSILMEFLFNYEELHGAGSSVNDLIPFINKRAEDIYDFSVFYKEYFHDGRDDIYDWKWDNIDFGTDGEDPSVECSGDTCTNRIDKWDDFYTWDDYQCDDPCKTACMCTYQLVFSDGDTIITEYPTTIRCDYDVYEYLGPDVVTSSAVTEYLEDWISESISADWEIYPDIVQTQMDVGLNYRFMVEEDDLCIAGGPDMLAIKPKECEDDDENQQWFLDSSISTQLTINAGADSLCLATYHDDEWDIHGVVYQECLLDFDVSQQWIVEKTSVDTETYKFYSVEDKSIMCVSVSGIAMHLVEDETCEEGADEFLLEENDDGDLQFYNELYDSYIGYNGDVGFGAGSWVYMVPPDYSGNYLFSEGIDHLQAGTRSFVVQSVVGGRVWEENQLGGIQLLDFNSTNNNQRWIEEPVVSLCLTTHIVEEDYILVKYGECSSDSVQWIVEQVDTDTYKFYSPSDNYVMCVESSIGADFSVITMVEDGSCEEGGDEFVYKENENGDLTLYHSVYDFYIGYADLHGFEDGTYVYMVASDYNPSDDSLTYSYSSGVGNIEVGTQSIVVNQWVGLDNPVYGQMILQNIGTGNYAQNVGEKERVRGENTATIWTREIVSLASDYTLSE